MDKHTETKHSATMIIFSGNVHVLQDQLRAKAGIVVNNVKTIDEKTISRLGEMLNIIRSKPKTETICFGCKNLESQRYQFVLKSYLLLSGASRRFLIDEQGNRVVLNFFWYICKDIPKFIAELTVSMVVVSAVYIQLLTLRSFTGRKQNDRN